MMGMLCHPVLEKACSHPPELAFQGSPVSLHHEGDRRSQLHRLSTWIQPCLKVTSCTFHLSGPITLPLFKTS